MLLIRRASMIAGCLGLMGFVFANTSVHAATPLTTKLVANGLTRPIFVTHAPDDFDRIFIIEKQGIIKVLHINTSGASPMVFMNIDARVTGGTSDFSEQGLLGLAFDPDYANNGFFYVNYTNGTNTRISRFSVDGGNPDLGDDTSEVILKTIAQPQTNHNGGWIGFGPNDGMLYVATGDGGGGGDDDPGHTSGTGNGQDITNNLLGKILRYDVSGGTAAIPADNPFVGVTGDDDIWAYGLRNPWREAFDSLTGDLWIADVGQNAWEEVNVQPADSTGGENYGWRCREGMHNFNFQAFCSALTFVEPIHEYGHNVSPFGCSISGGEVYRGCLIPDLRGEYFFADFCQPRIWSIRFDFNSGIATVTDRNPELNPTTSINDITSFGRDAAGEVYICDQGGEIHQIFPGGATDAPTPFDWDNDGDVDDFDAKGIVECTTGPLGSFTDCQCDVFDGDTNGAIDLSDFLEFQIAFTG